MRGSQQSAVGDMRGKNGIDHAPQHVVVIVIIIRPNEKNPGKNNKILRQMEEIEQKMINIKQTIRKFNSKIRKSSKR